MDQKEIRKQLRKVLKDELPAILKSELGQELLKELQETVNGRMNGISKQVETSLKAIDTRSEQIHGLMMRQALTQSVEPSPAQVAETPVGTENPVQQA